VSRADRIGLLLMVGAVAFLAALASVVTTLERSRPRLDPDCGCAVDAAPTGELALLVDLTDGLSPTARREIKDWFRQCTRASVPDGQRVTIWALSGSPAAALQRRFARCRPSRSVNPWTGNEAMAAALTDSLFDAPFREALSALPGEEISASTPLLEAVHVICAQPEFARPRVPRRLVVASNLVENTKVVSFVTRPANFASLQRSGRLPAVDLRGVDVDVLFLPGGRTARGLDTSLEDFWRAYFTACGATDIRIWRL